MFLGIVVVLFGFNDCRVGFGWADITADCAVCLQSLLKALVSCLKTRAGQHQLPQPPNVLSRQTPGTEGLMSQCRIHEQSRMLSVWFVV